MSWIVQTLLSRATKIKEGSTSPPKEFRNTPVPITQLSDDIEVEKMGYKDPLLNDEFNDLMLIEKAIKELKNAKAFDSLDLEILEYVRDGDIHFSGEHELGLGRQTLSARFEAICERIAFYLGDYFTNEGYIEYMIDTYSLSREEETTLRNYIQSRYKHTLIRRKSKNDFTTKESV